MHYHNRQHTYHLLFLSLIHKQIDILANGFNTRTNSQMVKALEKLLKPHKNSLQSKITNRHKKTYQPYNRQLPDHMSYLLVCNFILQAFLIKAIHCIAFLHLEFLYTVHTQFVNCLVYGTSAMMYRICIAIQYNMQ